MAKEILLIGRIMFYLFALTYITSTFYWLPNLNISIWLSLGIMFIGTIISALIGAIIGIGIEAIFTTASPSSNSG